MNITTFLLLAPLAACSGLPNVLPSTRSHERDLPRPEDRAPAWARIAVEEETFRLENGLTVVLLEDHRLPRVVVDTWFAVGSRDEGPGRRGFAHLFEHLVLGPSRAPGQPLELRVERGGGASQASTSTDRASLYSMGPAALLPTLLELDAARIDALDEPLPRERLERLRDELDAERRRSTENVPYAGAERLLAEALYPREHPYHHALVGNETDLAAATVEDVQAFFGTFHVPASATLVVAGDFEPRATRALIEDTFGALAPGPAPGRASVAPATLTREVRIETEEPVEFPRLTLAWHSPARYAPGDAELELLATILAEGPDSRLDQRLVLDLCLAQEVDASQQSAELGSRFVIEAVAGPGADLEHLKLEILAVLEELVRAGPTAAELQRASARAEARFLRRMEGLLARAEAVQAYRRAFGVSDGFQRDLERRTRVTPEALRAAARTVFGPGRVDLRILPAL